MGARHSKRSMDVTTTPKKEGSHAEGGDTPVIGDGKLERIEEIDAKPTTNGVAPHIDTSVEKEINDKDSATEKEKEKNDEETKEVEETKVDTQAESPTEGGENVTTPTGETAANPNSVSSPETKESKKKDKPKKKWSFRSISFSKKDKNKPIREEAPKNGDVSKDEPLTEGGEDVENTAAVAEVNETDEKTPTTSPTESSTTPIVDAKEDEKTEPLQSSEATAEASSVDDKNETTVATPSSPIAPTPVPVEAKNDAAEIEEVEKKIVEVSPEQAVAAPVEVTTHTQPVVTPSIIERKTSEDFHSLFPSSPPPTPINPSPLQKAQQSAANADALAAALKIPAQTITQSQINSNLGEILENTSVNTGYSKENTIDDAPILDEQLINIPDKQENVSQLKELEEEVKEEVKIDSNVNLQPDLVIHTEEGPIPVSNSDIEVKIELVKNIDDEIIEKNDDEAPEISSKIINYDDKIVVDTEKNLIAEELYSGEIKSELRDDTPPPLPESPVPMPKTTTDLLNFMTSQIEDTTAALTDVLNISKPISTESVSSPAVSSEHDVANNILSDIKMESDMSKLSVNLPPPQDVEDLPLPPPEVIEYKNVQESMITNCESPIENLLTPPRSPSPTIKINHAINKCPPLEINGHDTNTTVNDEIQKDIVCEIRLESMKQNNSDTNNDDTINNLKDKLIHTVENEEENTGTMVSCPLTHHVDNDEQSTVESVTTIEKNIADECLTEIIQDTPKNVIAEIPVSPSSKAPMITEDVASVTKAVEEMNINEKAVAAAVNENIECVTKNEIIAEMNHQNNLNE